MDGSTHSFVAEAPGAELRDHDRALVALLKRLATEGYDFVTPTISTHRRVTHRFGVGLAKDLRDIFGWNLPFKRSDIDPEILALMKRGRVVARRGLHLTSRVRVACLHGRLFLHSAFPPNAADAVFFGPDSYRFADFIRAEFPTLRPGARIADIGTGSGVGGITALGLAPGSRLVMTDINPKALELARINAAFADASAQFVQTSGLDGVSGSLDLIVANPPFIAGKGGRTYRDGGDMHGAEISLAWAKAAVERLAPGGRFLMYTGSAIVGGQDRMRDALAVTFKDAGCSFAYREIDPDIFGGTLLLPAYWEVERIAAVGVVAVKT